MSRARLLILIAAMALLVLPSCGGGDDASGTNLPGNTQRGAAVLGFPFLPEVLGQSVTVGIKNLTARAAKIFVTAYLPNGTNYGPGTITVFLDPSGEQRFPLSDFTGGDAFGGWLKIDTRNLDVIDPGTGLPTISDTTGWIAATLFRATGATETDGAGAIAPRKTFATVSLTEQTTGVQLINWSDDTTGGGGAADVDFEVLVFDAYGDLQRTFMETVPGNGSLRVDTSYVQTGLVLATPQGLGGGEDVRFGIAAIEQEVRVLVEDRYLEVSDPEPQQYNVAFDVEFGEDPDFNIHDFSVLISNPTNAGAVVLLSGVYDQAGNSYLPQARAISLSPVSTKLEATTTFDSRGLAFDAGEVSVFNDIFGNVDFATGFGEYTLVFSVPRSVNISARDFDSRFDSYARIIPGYRQTTDVLVPSFSIETSSLGGTRNWIVIMNPYATAQTVNVRGYTPGGTEYIDIDPIVLPPYSRIWWSADGLRFTEDPSSTTQPPVPFMSFLFSASGGVFFDARRWRVDNLGQIRFQIPYYVRNLRTD